MANRNYIASANGQLTGVQRLYTTIRDNQVSCRSYSTRDSVQYRTNQQINTITKQGQFEANNVSTFATGTLAMRFTGVAP